jgi:hypothetical protein
MIPAGDRTMEAEVALRRAGGVPAPGELLSRRHDPLLEVGVLMVARSWSVDCGITSSDLC